MVEIIKIVISYLKNLKTRSSYTARKAIDFEYTNDASPNFIKFVGKYKLEGVPYDIGKESDINKMCVNKNDKIWKSDLANSPKAISYILFKTTIKLENYIHKIIYTKLYQ